MRSNGCVSIGDTDMYYVAYGTGEKKLVVLPGLSDGLVTVNAKALFFASTYRKFANDYTVYTFSRKNVLPEDYTIEQMAEDQVEAMNKLGIERAYVLGISQGGMIAQYVAINHPEVVEKLILAVTAEYANVTVKENINNWIEMASNDKYIELITDTANKMYTERDLSKIKGLIPFTAKILVPKSFDRYLINCRAILGFDARKGLSKIECPTLVISGDRDITVGNDAPEAFKNSIKDCEVFVYEGLGHGAFEEAKDFYDRVHEFCEK